MTSSNKLNNKLQVDEEITEVINQERNRQEEHLELIASENYASKAVMEAQGSVLTNKYAEGYPGKRYYNGCQHVDVIEKLAISRLKQLFGCHYANVQPHSGSQANQAVYLALLNPHDKVMGMALDQGGHLTHGARVNISGKWFENVTYGISKQTETIDYEELRRLAWQEKPKLIIAGISAYSRELDFAKFRQIADEVGAYLLADIAHISGIVATGYCQSPIEYADVVTSTTHKTLRGPRGGIIMTNNEQIAKKVDFAVFPGLQGGPLMHVIAAKAVAFKEALEDSFKDYISQVIANAKALAAALEQHGLTVLSGGSDNHMVIVNLYDLDISGKQAADTLEAANITCNKNTIPEDPRSPAVTSGVRFGTAANITCNKILFLKIQDLLLLLLAFVLAQQPLLVEALKNKSLRL